MEWKFSLLDIKKTATALWKLYGDKQVWAFHGAMGSGKTTFIHALCDVKGVKDVVSSPTFSLINEYLFTEEGITKKIFHIDLYRLKDEEEARLAGIEDCLYSDHTCFVEWPDRAPGLLPPDALHVYIDTVDEETRKLQIAKI